jgi:hypothetical protein
MRPWRKLDKNSPTFNVGTANLLEMLTLLFTPDVHGNWGLVLSAPAPK